LPMFQNCGAFSIRSCRPCTKLVCKRVPISGVSTTVMVCGSGLCGSDTKRTTILKHWQADEVKFEMQELIGLTTSSKKPFSTFLANSKTRLTRPRITRKLA